MNRPILTLYLSASALLSSCLSQQIGNQVAYVKHTKPLHALFGPPVTTCRQESPHLISSWVHKGSKYTIRAKNKNSIHNWLIEVEHPNGTRYRHRSPEPPFSKALRQPSTRTLSVSHCHEGERLTLTLRHLNNARITLHAHNLGVITPDQQADSSATAALAHAVQQGGHISLNYRNEKEYKLTAWEQEALRRMLRGAIATPQQPGFHTLLFHSPDGHILYELALGEYWPYNSGPHGFGIPTMKGAILAGDFPQIYLLSWWKGVCCRLSLPDSNSHSQPSHSGPGAIDGTTLDKLLKKQ